MVEDQEMQGQAFNAMALAIEKYISAMGGSALVVGGVSIEKDPNGLKLNYTLRVGITGNMPTKRNV
jgi:hypothetical protein